MYNLKNVKPKRFHNDIDKAFDLLDRKDINFKSFDSMNLGVFIDTDVNNDELIYIDTSIEDLLSLDPHFDFKVIRIGTDTPPFFVHIRNYKKGDFRGEVGFIPKHTLYLEQSIMPNKKIVSERLPMYPYKNGWRCAIKYIDNCKIPEVKQSLDIASLNVQTSILYAWEDFFKWKIRAKMPEWEKSIDFYINPSNIKQVFKMRDIKDGEQRRKALKHIVNSHERTLSNGEKIEILRYLRGKEKFSQNGYELTVIPSKDDILSTKGKI